MTEEQFEALVGKLEERARTNPAAYRLRVSLLALLGNVYLAVILLIVVALLLASIASIAMLKIVGLKLTFVITAFLWMVIKALWVRIEPPSGAEVTARQAPDLFVIIDELQQSLGTSRFHHVLITDEFNAGVVQRPRLGIFGWSCNYLMIGLPLMKGLTVEQFRAILAHEFGHLAKGHGRMSNWIYRQRLRWSRLATTLEASRSSGNFLFKPFLNWFAPHFNAYSFQLARANEYEADSAAARLTSPRAAAEALTSVNVVGAYLAEQYWPQIHKMADELPQPGFAPYSNLTQRVSTDLNDPRARQWLDQAMARKTSHSDTHPALSDRLNALGESPHIAPPSKDQAADQLLGSVLHQLTENFDRRWHDEILPSWEKRHREVQENRRRLGELNTRHDSGGELSLQDAFDRATLTESVGEDAETALAQFHALLERAPDEALACFGLGARLLAREEESGGALIERAIQLDSEATMKGCELLRDYHWRNGRKEQANAWHQRLVEHAQLLQAAQRERNEVLLSDEFQRPEFSEEQYAALRIQLHAVAGLRKAYFLRKQLKYLTERPCYVLGFKVTGLFQFHSARRANEVTRRIRQTVEFPGDTIVISVEGKNYRFGRAFRRMRWATIV